MKTRSQQEIMDVAQAVDDAVVTTIQAEFSTFINLLDFRNKLKEVITMAMAETIKAALTALKGKITKIENQLVEVQENSNDNEQYSRCSNVHIYRVEPVVVAAAATATLALLPVCYYLSVCFSAVAAALLPLLLLPLLHCYCCC